MSRAIPAGYLTADQAAKRAEVGRETIFRWIRNGVLKRYRMAGVRQTLVKLSELEPLLGPRQD